MTADGASVALDDALSLVSEEVGACTKCPLHLKRTNPVPGEGPPDARALFIGEGPGRNEDLEGRPFVGAAGKQLESFLKEAGLRRNEVFITNVVKCRPPDNRRPTTDEAEACRPFLERQLALVRPAIVVLLGDTALKRFLPEERLPTAHGRLYNRGRMALFPSYHPAAMIYNRALESTIKRDFGELKRILSGLGSRD